MNETINLSEHDFINKYWYASELKKLAKSIGIPNTEKYRKDELKEMILKYLKTGTLNIPIKSQSNYSNNVDDALSLNSVIQNYKNNKETWIFITRINEYIRLNHIDRLPQIPSAKFNNFITDYLKNEKGKTRTDAIKAWEKLKEMSIPKDYDSWKKS